MKNIIFRKGINTVKIPFMLSEFSPWQEQITTQIKRMKSNYKVRKSAHWGFTISENGAEINVYKN